MILEGRFDQSMQTKLQSCPVVTVGDKEGWSKAKIPLKKIHDKNMLFGMDLSNIANLLKYTSSSFTVKLGRACACQVDEAKTVPQYTSGISISILQSSAQLLKHR